MSVIGGGGTAAVCSPIILHSSCTENTEFLGLYCPDMNICYETCLLVDKGSEFVTRTQGFCHVITAMSRSLFLKTGPKF
jgi:hypothetical protein